ncbi:MAG: hypothetical protein HN514_06105 [Candidatus Marinimicrobia bacterium]|jgi:hypothetical protein|nr:hypothetical protein [Candidatus Neomarinimicrobiota bacterium]
MNCPEETKGVIIMNNSNQVTNTTEVVHTSSTKYTGEKAPMVNMTMLKTSKAITGAIDRIEVRRSWIQSRKGELLDAFNTNDPVVKHGAYVEAERLATSISGLNEKEQDLKEKLVVAQEEELALLEDLEFPEFSI